MKKNLTPRRVRWAKERRGLVNPTRAADLGKVVWWVQPITEDAQYSADLDQTYGTFAASAPLGTCNKYVWCQAKNHHPDCPIAGVK